MRLRPRYLRYLVSSFHRLLKEEYGGLGQAGRRRRGHFLGGLLVTNIVVTPISTSPFTAIAVANNFTVYIVDNSSGSGFTFNLPPIPAVNEIITIVDGLWNAGTYAITISGNGNNISAYTGAQSSIGINSNGGSVTMAWDKVEGQWVDFA